MAMEWKSMTDMEGGKGKGKGMNGKGKEGMDGMDGMDGKGKCKGMKGKGKEGLDGMDGWDGMEGMDGKGKWESMEGKGKDGKCKGKGMDGMGGMGGMGMEGMGGIEGMDGANPMAFMMNMIASKGGGKGADGMDPQAFMMGLMQGMGGMMGGKGMEKGGKGKAGKPGVPWEYPEERPEPTSLREASDWKNKGWVDHTGKNWEEVYSTDPKVIKIALPADSPIVTQGFPSEAPSICCYNAKGHDLFSQSANILHEIVGDSTTMVKIEHDTEGDQFTDVLEAVKAAGGDKNLSLAVGVCPEAAKWAVGLGAGKQARERAVKLSLSVALAASDAGIVGTLAQTYPGFAQLCAQLREGVNAPVSQATKKQRTQALLD